MLANTYIIQKSKSLKSKKSKSTDKISILRENLYNLHEYNKINTLNLTYLFVDNDMSDIFLQNIKSLQVDYKFLKYIKLSKDVNPELNLNIQEIAKIYDCQFILNIENLEAVNLKIIDKFLEKTKQEINKNKVHIYNYKDIEIKIEKNIFKKILLYLKS